MTKILKIGKIGNKKLRFLFMHYTYLYVILSIYTLTLKFEQPVLKFFVFFLRQIQKKLKINTQESKKMYEAMYCI